MPGGAPKPRSRSSRIAPYGGRRPASCATRRRGASAGPKVLAARPKLLAAPNRRAPTGLAQRIRVPSVDHSQAGSALVACTESCGSVRPRNWNSEWFIALVTQIRLLLPDDGVNVGFADNDSLNKPLVLPAGGGRSTGRAQGRALQSRDNLNPTEPNLNYPCGHCVGVLCGARSRVHHRGTSRIPR